MKIEQIYTGCLAEASYYIESDGEAIIIDPLRETGPYLEKIKKEGSTLKYIFETHFHADFVSGHVELAQKTGAQILYGPNAQTNFDARNLSDGEEVELGKIKIKAIHTPGHTLESTCYLLIDANNEQRAIFTGDTLFIGDVGRPDLAIDNGLSKEDLAGMLFDSLREKVMVLDDHITVYPAHGAGSACGKNMSKETYDTLGNQKKLNYALRADMGKEEFVKEVLDGMPPAPKYFAHNAALNQKGYENLDEIKTKALIGHSAKAFEKLQKENKAIVLDTRHQTIFKDGFIPGSIFIGINGSFAPWVGALLEDVNRPLLFIADEGKEDEVVTRLSRVGFDNNLGFLKGGIEAWKNEGLPVDSINSISADHFADLNSEGDLDILDVRKPGEYNTQHIATAKLSPLDFVFENLDVLAQHQGKRYVHCAGGYRSIIYCSILKANGIHDLVDVAGGFGAIKKNEKFKLTVDMSCSSNIGK